MQLVQGKEPTHAICAACMRKNRDDCDQKIFDCDQNIYVTFFTRCVHEHI